MADNEQSPDKFIKPPYKEKKCEREFRKLLETTNLKAASSDSDCSPEKSKETTQSEKKCEREFRKLLETTNSNTANKEIEICTENANTEKKCDTEFQKLLPTKQSGTNSGIHYNNENAIPEKKRKEYKLNEPDLNDDSSSNSSITSFSHFQKCKAMCSGESSGSLKQETSLIVSTGTLSSSASLADLQAIYDCLEEEDNSLETKCECVISLTVLCSEDLSADRICSSLGALNLLKNTQNSDALAFCHSLLLFTLTRQNLNSEQIIYLEEQIMKLTDSVIEYEKGFGNIIGLRMILQSDGHYLKAYKLCQKLFAEKNLDIDAIDVLTLCCSSIKNLSACEVGKTYRYKDRTLKFILGMTGKATQEIVAENLIGADDGYTFVSAPSHMVNQCLSAIEHMLSLDRDSPCTALDHEDFSLLHCLTRLLGWCLSYLFQKEQSENNFLNTQHSSLSSFHLSTLVSILKILAMLSFPPSQHYDSFTNIKGLMEKIMICILKVYFQSEEKRFDVLVLALELMINFFLKNKRYFVLLCLKKFEINSCEQILTIEGLLKILGNSLEKINDIKQKPLTVEKEDDDEDSSSENPPDNLKLVSDAAEEDFELSTIVSFTSILLVFFMDTKQSFVDFIRERLPQEKSSEAIIVSKKVLQFASITGGMPVTGILLLRHAIRKLSRLYTAQPATEPPTTEAPTTAAL